VHLHVGDLERGLAFYRDVLGLELMTFMLAAAAFVSAGGYHHLGFNVWRG
jgi:catechol 2,3-dioxygenase